MARAQRIDPDPTAAVVPGPALLHGQVARELDECGFGRVVHGAGEALVADEAAHGRDEHDRAAGFEAQHLARRGSGGHEDACVVDRKHLRGVGDCVVDCRAGFLYPGGGYQTVRPLIFLSYPGDDTIKRFVVPHVYLRVVQLAAEFGEDALRASAKKWSGSGRRSRQ